jgi:uroporphyrinogen III methyltransferase/synthase
MKRMMYGEDAKHGMVYLVGAGPGDPGLLTVKGAKLLELAEVVVYDALANPALLKHCPQAAVIYVGKKAADHSMTQEQINDLLVRTAREGKRIVRLKGGDPFVFGRGGEECEALAAAGVPFEVVPGITAAIAAPAYAGIPVTHRDLNSSFTLITGHEKEEAYRDPAAQQRSLAAGSSDIDWPSVAKLPCVAFYMGVKSLARICSKLIEHGKDPATPAATIQQGTTPKQRTIVGTLQNLAQRVAEAQIAAPAITIVGRVVEMRKTIGWFENRPLFGQTIVVTRTRQQASDLSRRLEHLGADVIEAPTIQLHPPSDWKTVDAALNQLKNASTLKPHRPAFDWVIFTSANGVSHTKARLFQIGLDARIFNHCRIAAIGAATAQAIRDQLCLDVDLCPEQFVAEALADALKAKDAVAGSKFLLLRADIARPILRERLVQDGAADVSDVAVYETRAAEALPQNLTDALAQRRVQWITFTSSSTAKSFFNLLPGDRDALLAGVRTASIGPITSATLRELGAPPTVEARQFDIEGLVQAILESSARGVEPSPFAAGS